MIDISQKQICGDRLLESRVLSYGVYTYILFNKKMYKILHMFWFPLNKIKQEREKEKIESENENINS